MAVGSAPVGSNHPFLHQIYENVEQQPVHMPDIPHFRERNVEDDIGEITQAVVLRSGQEHPLKAEDTRLSQAGDDGRRNSGRADAEQHVL